VPKKQAQLLILATLAHINSKFSPFTIPETLKIHIYTRFDRLDAPNPIFHLPHSDSYPINPLYPKLQIRPRFKLFIYKVIILFSFRLLRNLFI
jgi:hypothetical protein